MRYFLIIMVFFGFQLKAQESVEGSLVLWYDIETAEKLAAQNPKPLLIDVYTDWCGWCKHMMKTTFANQHIANYINTNYYPVRLNAESNDTIVFKDSTYYSFQSGTKYIQGLAYSLLNGRMSYPSFVYMDVNGQSSVIPGYQDVRKQEPIMYYFAEKINRSTPFDYYERMFWYAYPNAYSENLNKLSESEKFDSTGVVNWMSLEEAFKKQAQQPKKIFIDIYAQGVVSNTIMSRTNYRNATIANMLNTDFYPVKLDALSKDTIRIGGNAFVNSPQHPFHDLAVQFAANNNRLMLPTIVFIDEKGNAITRLQEYLNPVTMETFLEFIKQDKFKTIQFQDFVQTYQTKLTY